MCFRCLNNYTFELYALGKFCLLCARQVLRITLRASFAFYCHTRKNCGIFAKFVLFIDTKKALNNTA